MRDHLRLGVVLLIVAATSLALPISNNYGVKAASLTEKPQDPALVVRRLAGDLSRYEDQIELNRKGQAVLTIEGEPGQVVDVEITQISHDFLFGNAPEYLIYVHAPHYRRARYGPGLPTPEELAVYRTAYLKLFNYAILPAFYWRDYEPYPHTLPLAEAAEKVAEWLQASGVIVKGHPLVWGNRETVGVPDWIQRLERQGRTTEVKAAILRRITRETTRFRELVDEWDVVNEPVIHPWLDHLDPNLTARAFRQARESDPKATLVLNEFGVLTSYIQRSRFLNRARELLKQGAPVDVIGVEGHIFLSRQNPVQLLMNLGQIHWALDEIAELGLPIYITEFEIPLPVVETAFGVTGEEAEIIQAELARVFYTLFFSHPAVESITYWNMYKAWQSGSGLLDESFRPKPIYHTLDELINKKWKTRMAKQVALPATLTWEGFYGDYQVVISGPDSKEATLQLYLAKGAENTYRVSLD